MQRHQTEQIEEWIDRYGVQGVLLSLAHISEGKSRHIQEAWQDKELSRAWGKQAQALEALAQKAKEQRL